MKMKGITVDIIFTDELDDVRYNPAFSAAEVQQLREVLKSQLNNMERQAEVCADNARFCKEEDRLKASDALWKEHFKIKTKIKKLAALQSKMKKFDVLY